LFLANVGKTALSAVLSVSVTGHEDSGTASFAGTLPPQSGYLSMFVDLVEFKDRQLDLLLLMLVLLGGGVLLLLPLLGTSSEPQHKMKGTLLLDVVVTQGPSVLELLTGEDQPLLVRGDSLFILDFSLHILDRVTRLNLEGDCLTREGFDKDLHPSN